jgi:hypothetical protein
MLYSQGMLTLVIAESVRQVFDFIVLFVHIAEACFI